MRAEINEKQGRLSERSEDARVKGAKQGKSSWEVGGRGVSSPPNGVQGQSPWQRLGIDRTFQTDRYLILGVCKVFL